MFIFNPILTFRNLYRYKANSLISISGFTLGLVATIFLYFYITDELSYDSFHQDKDTIYRAIRVSQINGSPYNIGVTSGPYARALENDFPSAITSATRAYPNESLVGFGDKRFSEDKLMYADANFFEFFSFPLLVGDKETVLKESNSAVLSQDVARKYFGDEDPIGKVLTLDNEFSFIVTGVMAELPAKSHLDFNIVLSIDFLERYRWFMDWWSNGLMTYVKIPSREVAANVDQQLVAFMDKYFSDDFERSGNRVDLTLEPLDQIYFNNQTRYDRAVHGDINTIYILGIVALAILFIACFNYVNLSIAQSFMRAKEVGVRKVLGVRKRRLVLQFLGESVMVLLIAVVLSIGICELLNPVFNTFFDLTINLRWLDPTVLIFFAALFVVVLITSGVYPALLLASFKSIDSMKGGKLSSGRSGTRKSLVVIQFAISIFLIVATLLISAQTDYLNSKELGFDREAVLLIDLDNGSIRRERQRFKERLLSNTNILKVSKVSGEPGGFHDASSFDITGIDGNHRMRTVFTDTDYLDLFGIEIIAGRNFSDQLDSDSVVVMMMNERAVSELGVNPQEIIGRKADMPTWGFENIPIVGIASNYHFNSLKNDLEPLAILIGPYHGKLAIKLNMKDINESLLFIDQVFSELAPGFPMTYEFLDERLERLYEDEQKQARVFSVFSMISIFLACLGIFGLAAYAAQARQKELGIRKVLGASPHQIIGLISRDFVLLVVIAAGVAAPAAWYFMENWLADFAHRIAIIQHWHVFLFGGLATTAIALLTISIKTYRAAIADPTESIRNE